MFGFFLVFFFSSRRRHTRWPRDWSSDVCSSDLLETNNAGEVLLYGPLRDIYFNTSKGNSILRELKSCEEKVPFRQQVRPAGCHHTSDGHLTEENDVQRCYRLADRNNTPASRPSLSIRLDLLL